MNRFRLPKGYSIKPIHVNGLAESLEESPFFAHAVSFSKLLEEN
ncbi:hypothetical protein [Candidatus Neptunochlamydia vexilliferae]|nr:hypothetical protein [Candidatus Neptunochlamydia vexilliferae]